MLGRIIAYNSKKMTRQVNKKFRKFEVDCIKMNRDKIGTQTCYIATSMY